MRFPTPTLRRLLNLSFWLVIAALAGNLMFRTFVSHKRIHAAEFRQSYHPIPFTAVIEDIHFDSAGNLVSRSEQKWAVRSDGSRMIEASTLDQTLKRASRYVQFSSGEEVREDMMLGTKSTTYYEDSFANSWIRTPSSNCLDSLEGTPMAAGQVMHGSETVDGFDTVKISLGTMTWWFAPKYGCAPVKTTIEEGAGGRNEQRLVSLVPGEPTLALFEIPTSLKEVNPSTAESMQRAAYCKPGGSACRAKDPRILENMDENYASHQAH